MVLRVIIMALLTTFILSTGTSADNTIYTWTDEKGVRHMSNIPPVDSEIKFEILETRPPQVVGNPRTQSSPAPKNSRDKYTTKVSIVNNHVIVPVTLAYKKKKVKANLLLDTGASNITLHRSVAKQLKIKKHQKGTIRVAGGDMIDADGVILTSVTVGPHTKEDLLAGIIDHNGNSVPYEGLLDMNFLKNYHYTIDFKKKLLHWSK